MAGISNEDHLELMHLVKEGKLTVEQAQALLAEAARGHQQHRSRCGLEAANVGKTYNFSVYLSIGGKSQRYILQVNFTSRSLTTVERGVIKRRIPFPDINRVETDDGLKVTIFVERGKELEFDADSLEERNKICRLISGLCERDAYNEEESQLVEDDSGRHERMGNEKATSEVAPILEGIIEKKGHSAAFLTWTKRHLRLCRGELTYFKPDDLSEALNIVSLRHGSMDVKKVENNIFIVDCNKRAYTFRIPNPSNSKPPGSVQKERDQWYDAIKGDLSATSRHPSVGARAPEDRPMIRKGSSGGLLALRPGIRRNSNSLMSSLRGARNKTSYQFHTSLGSVDEVKMVKSRPVPPWQNVSDKNMSRTISSPTVLSTTNLAALIPSSGSTVSAPLALNSDSPSPFAGRATKSAELCNPTDRINSRRRAPARNAEVVASGTDEWRNADANHSQVDDGNHSSFSDQVMPLINTIVGSEEVEEQPGVHNTELMKLLGMIQAEMVRLKQQIGETEGAENAEARVAYSAVSAKFALLSHQVEMNAQMERQKLQDKVLAHEELMKQQQFAMREELYKESLQKEVEMKKAIEKRMQELAEQERRVVEMENLINEKESKLKVEQGICRQKVAAAQAAATSAAAAAQEAVEAAAREVAAARAWSASTVGGRTRSGSTTHKRRSVRYKLEKSNTVDVPEPSESGNKSPRRLSPAAARKTNSGVLLPHTTTKESPPSSPHVTKQRSSPPVAAATVRPTSPLLAANRKPLFPQTTGQRPPSPPVTTECPPSPLAATGRPPSPQDARQVPRPKHKPPPLPVAMPTTTATTPSDVASATASPATSTLVRPIDGSAAEEPKPPALPPKKKHRRRPLGEVAAVPVTGVAPARVTIADSVATVNAQESSVVAVEPAGKQFDLDLPPQDTAPPAVTIIEATPIAQEVSPLAAEETGAITADSMGDDVVADVMEAATGVSDEDKGLLDVEIVSGGVGDAPVLDVEEATSREGAPADAESLAAGGELHKIVVPSFDDEGSSTSLTVASLVTGRGEGLTREEKLDPVYGTAEGRVEAETAASGGEGREEGEGDVEDDDEYYDWSDDEETEQSIGDAKVAAATTSAQQLSDIAKELEDVLAAVDMDMRPLELLSVTPQAPELDEALIAEMAAVELEAEEALARDAGSSADELASRDETPDFDVSDELASRDETPDVEVANAIAQEMASALSDMLPSDGAKLVSVQQRDEDREDAEREPGKTSATAPLHSGKPEEESATAPGGEGGQKKDDNKKDPAVPGAPPPSSPPPPPPPPPPPGMAGLSDGPPPGMNARKKVTPGAKMRPFHWAKMSSIDVVKSFWREADDLLDMLDGKHLEQHFNMEAAKAVVIEKKDAKKLIMESGKARNVGIFLSGCKLSVPEISRRLLETDSSSCLPVKHIIELKRFQPSADDREVYKKFTGSISTLQDVDQFMYQLCKVSKLSQYIDMQLLLQEFPMQLKEMETVVRRGLEACNQIFLPAFKHLLEYILAIGNYMNAGTPKGNCFGFKISSLQQVCTIRGKDRKYTMPHFLYDHVLPDLPVLKSLPKDMSTMREMSEMSLRSLAGEIEVMGKDLDKIMRIGKQLIDKDPTAAEKAFHGKVIEFEREQRAELVKVQKLSGEMNNKFSKALMFLGEPPSTDSYDVFVHISGFLNQFERVMVERETEEEAEKRRLEKKKWGSDKTFEGVKPSGSLESSRKDSSISLAAPATAQPAVNKRPLTKPTRKGYLLKRSGGKHRAAKFDRRFFELEEAGSLYYYKKEGAKALGAIYLRGVVAELDVEDNTQISFIAEDRQWVLKAESTEEAEAWLTDMGAYF